MIFAHIRDLRIRSLFCGFVRARQYAEGSRQLMDGRKLITSSARQRHLRRSKISAHIPVLSKVSKSPTQSCEKDGKGGSGWSRPCWSTYSYTTGQTGLLRGRESIQASSVGPISSLPSLNLLLYQHAVLRACQAKLLRRALEIYLHTHLLHLESYGLIILWTCANLWLSSLDYSMAFMCCNRLLT